MEIISGLQFIGQVIFIILYIASPDFREDQRLKEIEKKKAHETFIINKKKEEFLIKQQIRTDKINKNEDLINVCFDDSYLCINDQILLSKLKNNLNDPNFRLNFLNTWEKSFSSSYYGCFCRTTPKYDIYEKCPVQNSKLDLVCKVRHDCIKSKNLRWNSLSQCDLELIEIKNTYKYVELRDKNIFDNDTISLLYARKYYALLKLKDLFN